MCGIFGFISSGLQQHKPQLWNTLLKRLCLLSESRGKEASGLVVISHDAIYVLKQPVRLRQLLKMSEFDEISDHLSRAVVSGKPFLVMGHARMVTNGRAETHENNQPVVRDDMVCIHNGIIVNEADLWKSFPNLTRHYEVDTEIMLALSAHFQKQKYPVIEAFCNSFNMLNGANSVAIVAENLNAAFLATSNGSLFLALTPNHSEAFFASEKYILVQSLRHAKLPSFFSDATIEQIQPGCACLLNFESNRIDRISIVLNNMCSNTSILQGAHSREIKDISPKTFKFVPKQGGVTREELEHLCTVDYEAILSLRRCSKCLLPETFPFIHFDNNGVCNYCHNYRPWNGPGKEALERYLEPLRNKNGQPDCLVPLSGGRDSSFALHYVKKELHMNPVAYTYDWGMVTDLARRNISRMCGELGVEHILISADIVTKRANIKKNVLAWLQHPHLGTVTLFMAGDKHFFHYARMLRQQMKLNATLFGMNPFERTDFKVGFCGIDENYQKEKHYNLSLLNKIRLILYFGRRIIENPSFINTTLWDSFVGFCAYYFIPKDYLSIYDYIRWDEQTINQTLHGEYDWESAKDTQSTWRIGDGTAAFYNYIYYRLAGFSENDTFLSNQIREGMMTREDAWGIACRDNRPRVEAIDWYCDTIGIDCRETIKRINEMPTLYNRKL
ncbi:hypothetical protein C4565_08240 [Candidatus Parcubacteria bacterium]|nr:MAG: hypothetical protein C4565_08240 [Candidatus Parcubacteria bacterium]